MTTDIFTHALQSMISKEWLNKNDKYSLTHVGKLISFLEICLEVGTQVLFLISALKLLLFIHWTYIRSSSFEFISWSFPSFTCGEFIIYLLVHCRCLLPWPVYTHLLPTLNYLWDLSWKQRMIWWSCVLRVARVCLNWEW